LAYSFFNLLLFAVENKPDASADTLKYKRKLFYDN